MMFLYFFSKIYLSNLKIINPFYQIKLAIEGNILLTIK